MNALLWFTLKYTFHRFQLTLVVLSIMTYKREKKRNLFIYFHITETQNIINMPKFAKIYHSHSAFDIKCFME